MPRARPQIVSDLTDGKFQIQPFAGGEIVPLAGIVDAVQNDTVEMGHTATYYYFGKDPTFAFGCTVPFGLNSRQLNAWWYYGGALELMNKFYAKFNMIGFPAGNTGAPDGRLVAQGDQHRRRPQGRQVPRRRLRRRGARQARRHPAPTSRPATSIRRWRRARSTPPSSSAPTTT